jgi:hypothetical protein
MQAKENKKDFLAKKPTTKNKNRNDQNHSKPGTTSSKT